MKRLLNTLYVTGTNRYLSLDGENVVVLEEREEVGRVPLHNLQSIVTFGYTGASPALMGTCAQRNIDLTFMSGNVILSRLVDTFFSRISLTMPPAPKSHNTACVLPREEPLHWQSRSSGYSSS